MQPWSGVRVYLSALLSHPGTPISLMERCSWMGLWPGHAIILGNAKPWTSGAGTTIKEITLFSLVSPSQQSMPRNKCLPWNMASKMHLTSRHASWGLCPPHVYAHIHTIQPQKYSSNWLSGAWYSTIKIFFYLPKHFTILKFQPAQRR